MTPDHTTDSDLQKARAALASMPPARRAFLEVLHAQYFPRADGGMVYPLEGLVCHLLGAERHGVADEQVARALGVPAEYLVVVQEAVGLTPGG
jgi:hypothetical protein